MNIKWIFLSFLLISINHNAMGFGGLVDDVKEIVGDAKEFYSDLTNYDYEGFHLKLSPSLKNPSATLTYSIKFKSRQSRGYRASNRNSQGKNAPINSPKEITFNSLEAILADNRISKKHKDVIRKIYLPRLRAFQASLKSVSEDSTNSLKARRVAGRPLIESEKEFKSEFRKNVKRPLEKLVEGVPNVQFSIE